MQKLKVIFSDQSGWMGYKKKSKFKIFKSFKVFKPKNKKILDVGCGAGDF